ncbi:hypothetical protein, partial [Vibrio harveyi]
SLVILSKILSTKSKTLLAEPFGLRLWLLSTALSAYQVGQLHFKASASFLVYKEGRTHKLLQKSAQKVNRP